MVSDEDVCFFQNFTLSYYPNHETRQGKYMFVLLNFIIEVCWKSDIFSKIRKKQMRPGKRIRNTEMHGYRNPCRNAWILEYLHTEIHRYRNTCIQKCIDTGRYLREALQNAARPPGNLPDGLAHVSQQTDHKL